MDLLGTIVVVQNASRNNLTTGGTPFSIPSKYGRVLVVTPAASTVIFHIRVGSGDSSFVSDVNQFGVGDQTSQQVTLPSGSANPLLVAIWGENGGGSCKVYGLYGQAQS